MLTLVTGGAGFIGSNLADALLARGHEVRIIDDLSTGVRENLPAGARFFEGPITDPDLLEEAVAGVEVIFHQAALGSVARSVNAPLVSDTANAHGTLAVLDAAHRLGVRRVVQASSSSVYGGADVRPTPESTPLVPRSPYAVTKMVGEHYARVFSELHGLETVTLRYFNVYGPRMDTFGAYTEVLIRWMDRIGAGEPPLIFGDGSQTMDFVYVGDVARANVMAAESDVSDEVFNVATGVETSLNELAYTLMRVMGAEGMRPSYGPERKVNPVQRRLADVRLARERLGFQADVPLEDGLRQLVEWWQTQRELVAL